MDGEHASYVVSRWNCEYIVRKSVALLESKGDLRLNGTLSSNKLMFYEPDILSFLSFLHLLSIQISTHGESYTRH